MENEIQSGIPVPSESGPGTELAALLASLGINSIGECNCQMYAAQMNCWGVEGCKQLRDTIVQWLRENEKKYSWTDKLRAGANAVALGLFFNPFDPMPGLVDEAIRRAEEKK